MEEELRKLLETLDALPEGEERDGLESALEHIANLPTDQQQEAIRNLTADYAGRAENLRGDLERNFALATQEAPQGEMAGNNQFSVYVAASPLEHLATGMQKYQAGKGFKQARSDLDTLSQQQESGTGMVQQGMLAELLREREKKPKTPWWMTR